MQRKRLITFSSVIVAVLLGVVGFRWYAAQAVTRTWDGGGVTNNWSEAANWSDDMLPGSADTALFDGTSVKDATIDGAFGSIVRGVSITSAYTGTITQARSLTVGVDDWTQDGGTFMGATDAMVVNDDFTLTGGAFTTTSGSFSINGDILVDADAVYTTTPGNALFLGGDTSTINVGGVGTAGALVAEDVTIDFTIGNNRCKTITEADDILEVTGAFHIQDGNLCGDGMVDVTGTSVTFGSSTQGGDGTIRISGAFDVPLVDFDIVPGFILNNAGASITGPVGAQEQATIEGRGLVIQDGTFNAGPGEVLILGSMIKNGGLFNHDNGTIIFSGTLSDNLLGTISDGFVFYDFVAQQGLILASGGTLVVQNTLYMGSVHNGDTYEGAVRSADSGVQATIDFNGVHSSLYKLTVQDIIWDNASPAECFVECVDNGNNTNWNFTLPGSVSPGVTVTPRFPPSATTNEQGLSFSFEVVLNSQPTNTVTIPVASTDVSEGTVSTASLLFTSGDWDEPQFVDVTGVDDGLSDGVVQYNVTLGAATSADSNYNGLNPADVTVLNYDDETRATSLEYENADFYTQEDAVETEVGEEVAHLEDYWHVQTLVDSGQGVFDITNMQYDALNNSIWFPGGSANILRYDITGDVLHDYATGGTERGTVITHDTDVSRNRFWMVVGNEDAVVAFNDDGTVFGTFPLDERPISAFFTDAGDGDPANDAIWVGYSPFSSGGASSAVTKLHATDGTPYDTDLATSSYQVHDGSLGGNARAVSFTYDPGEDALWVLVTQSVADHYLVKLNQTTGAPFNGTLVNSTYGLSDTWRHDELIGDIIFDTTNDFVWVRVDDAVFAIDSTDGTLERYMSASSGGMHLDAANDELYISSSSMDGEDSGALNIYSTVTGELLNSGAVPLGGLIDVVQDGEGEPWVLRTPYVYGEGDFTIGGTHGIAELVYGVTENTYYTVSTSIVTSGWDVFTGMSVVEDLASEEISYSVSFDYGSTYNAWGSWRAIASNLTDVHGGTDGEWYYRDNADAWTADPSNSDVTAISLATEQGANNQTSGTVFSGLTQGDLQSLGGWGDSIDDIYFAASFLSTNYQNNPEVDRVIFSYVPTAPDIIVSVTDDVSAEDGDGATFDVVLTTEPILPVTISVTSDDLTEGEPDVAELFFSATDWYIPQTVTVYGADDVLIDGDVEYGVTLLVTGSGTDYSAINPDDPDLINLDDDVIPPSSGGGGAPPSVINGSLLLNDGAESTSSTTVLVRLGAVNATQYLLAEDGGFDDVAWEAFVPGDRPRAAETGGDANAFRMTASGYAYLFWDFPWAKDGDVLTLYAKYKNSNGDVSSVVVDSIVFDAESPEPPVIPPVLPPDVPVTPPSAVPTFVGTPGSPAVYLVDPSGVYHAFPDLQTYLTYADSCGAITYVAPSVITDATKGHFMMPKPGRALVKFPGDAKVYYVAADPTDSTKVILRWISSEEVAKSSFGATWNNYVIEVQPIEGAFSFGEPVNASLTGAADLLKSRAALNGQVTYTLYIINPDGERRLASDYAKAQQSTDGTVLYGFEDKTDMDYNDVVIRVDPRGCLSFAFSTLPLEARYHHQIGVQIFYDGKMQDDVILSRDSHASVNRTTVVDITNVEKFTPFEEISKDEAQTRGIRATRLIQNAVDNVYQRLQEMTAR